MKYVLGGWPGLIVSVAKFSPTKLNQTEFLTIHQPIIQGINGKILLYAHIQK